VYGYLKNKTKLNAKETRWRNAGNNSQRKGSVDAIEIQGANGFSNDYPVERIYETARPALFMKEPVIFHTLMQADWALGLKKEKRARITLPAYRLQKFAMQQAQTD